MADDELPSGDADAPEGTAPTMTAYGLIEPIEIEESSRGGDKIDRKSVV